jgi:hypothetical protein
VGERQAALSRLEKFGDGQIGFHLAHGLTETKHARPLFHERGSGGVDAVIFIREAIVNR